MAPLPQPLLQTCCSRKNVCHVSKGHVWSCSPASLQHTFNGAPNGAELIKSVVQHIWSKHTLLARRSAELGPGLSARSSKPAGSLPGPIVPLAYHAHRNKP